MVTIPQTPITEASFSKWKCFKVDIKDDESEPETSYYWVIPLVDVDENVFTESDDYYPHLWSSEAGEFIDDYGNEVYSVFVFDDDLPALTTEEEVEILYSLITKREIFN
jgi:hypothetical protein